MCVCLLLLEITKVALKGKISNHPSLPLRRNCLPGLARFSFPLMLLSGYPQVVRLCTGDIGGNKLQDNQLKPVDNGR